MADSPTASAPHRDFIYWVGTALAIVHSVVAISVGWPLGAWVMGMLLGTVLCLPVAYDLGRASARRR